VAYKNPYQKMLAVKPETHKRFMRAKLRVENDAYRRVSADRFLDMLLDRWSTR